MLALPGSKIGELHTLRPSIGPAIANHLAKVPPWGAVFLLSYYACLVVRAFRPQRQTLPLLKTIM